ncbi:hypothetical protein BpHYR1_026127 [Brachionus plicatilis]|uniref:Uncharacterized protein n=1 Tax=Brachionus plicatilis TaxID=10195 RepID=A0A3M7T7G4_BRAPC|nr:hypothetical protein BpHYR1_026127 [Brachionus plicatilis]
MNTNAIRKRISYFIASHLNELWEFIMIIMCNIFFQKKDLNRTFKFILFLLENLSSGISEWIKVLSFANINKKEKFFKGSSEWQSLLFSPHGCNMIKILGKLKILLSVIKKFVFSEVKKNESQVVGESCNIDYESEKVGHKSSHQLHNKSLAGTQKHTYSLTYIAL